VTGAGSDVRTNNAPAAGDDDMGVDDDTPAAGNPSASLSQFLLEDNGFTVHSFNATHGMHSLVSWNATVVYTWVKPLLAKLPSTGPLPAFPPIADLGPQCNPPPANADLRNMCLQWLRS
jgi:hypothetical protein